MKWREAFGRRSFLFVALALIAFALVASPARAATPKQVDDAIKKAKDFLRKQQSSEGHWEGLNDIPDNQFGGATAIATYALLAGGDSPQDEHIKKAVRWLGNADIKGIYALGLRAQVWTFLTPGGDVTKAVKRDATLLLNSADAAGRWGYTIERGGEHNSTTQYGVLGLWAASRMGYDVPTKFWKASEAGWHACQNRQLGTWGYESVVPTPDEDRPSMTVAGLASLFVAQDYLTAGHIRCAGNVTDDRIESGLKWLSDNFNPRWSDGYLLYGIERVGVASGYKYFGKHDWYAIGAETLVRDQQADGSWKYWGPEGTFRIPGTAFGIFFLSRGRAPVAMNKLRYDFEVPPTRKANPADVARWNQRPRDVANVVRWMGESMERDLNWQVVNLSEGIGAGDLLDAPILYMSGDQRLNLSAADKQKLKSYVEQGGIILGQADCGKPPFAASFRELGKELFPEYSFRPLPPGHFVFNEQYPATKWRMKVEVQGLSNGVRELMLLIPAADVAKSWQMRSTQQTPPHFQLMSNIFLYATDKANLRFKGETYVLKPDASIKPRRTIKLARIRHSGNWDPEPAGWRRLGTHLLNEHKLGLRVDTVQLGPDDVANESKSSGSGSGKSTSKAEPTPAVAKSLKGYDVAHLTGTDTFKLSQEARDEIRKFVESGGTLLIDAAGGATPFADAADAELLAMFKDQQTQLEKPLSLSHGAFNLPASKVQGVGYRTFTREKLGNLKVPRVRGLAIKDRTAVFVSKEDLSTALVGQPVDGVFGYDPKSALQLVTNLILYATNEGSIPATQPATQSTTKPVASPKP